MMTPRIMGPIISSFCSFVSDCFDLKAVVVGVFWVVVVSSRANGAVVSSLVGVVVVGVVVVVVGVVGVVGLVVVVVVLVVVVGVFVVVGVMAVVVVVVGGGVVVIVVVVVVSVQGWDHSRLSPLTWNFSKPIMRKVLLFTISPSCSTLKPHLESSLQNKSTEPKELMGVENGLASFCTTRVTFSSPPCPPLALIAILFCLSVNSST